MIRARLVAFLQFVPFLVASLLTIVLLAQEASAQTCPALSTLILTGRTQVPLLLPGHLDRRAASRAGPRGRADESLPGRRL